MEDSAENKVKQFFEECANSGLELRTGQTEMANEVCSMMVLKRPLAVEAGVGIGKSFAYLAPALAVYAREHRQIVIATSTIALQEQLYKDAQAVIQMMQIKPNIILVKGMKNYACMKRVRSLRKRYPKDNAIRMLWNTVRKGCQDKAQAGMKMDDTEWETIAISNYGGSYCHLCEYQISCIYHQLRLRILRFNDIVICNQNMLVSHLINKQTGRGIFIPGMSIVIVDEAHNLEPRFRNAFTKSYSKGEIIRAIKRSAENENAPRKIADDTLNQVQHLFQLLKNQIQRQRKQADGDMQTFYFEPTAQVRRLLETIKHHLPMIETEHELSEIYYFIRELYHNSGNCLVWLENTSDVRICISKKDIRRDIAELLYQTGRSTILTSATISSKQDGTPQERCSYFLDSIGYPKIGMVSEPKQSPYDYDHNTMVYCSASMPFPKHDRREEYLKASIPEIVKLLQITNGKALILFTAKTDMEYVYKRLSNMHLPFKILMQGKTSSQEYQLNKFRNDMNSVLLGTGIYWEGINVEGESLSHVIIYKLPFPVPDPIIDYKMSLTEHPIDDVAVPEMITKLRQGAGRLIRSANDKGIVSILDPRVSSNSRANYVSRTLHSLPMKNRTEDMEELQKFWDRIS